MLSTQLLQRWKVTSEAHFVPRPLPRPKCLQTSTAPERTAPQPAAADLPAIIIRGHEQQHQQKHQLQLERQPAPQLHRAAKTASDGTAASASQQTLTHGNNAPSPEQLFGLACLATTQRRSANESAQQYPDAHSKAECVHDADTYSIGVCKYYVNSGRCPRGALCPHAHDTSLRQRWLRDR